MNQLFFQRNTILLLLFLGSASLSFGQCGTEVPTISDYCPDQYAEFDIANSDPGIKYSWYDKIAGPDTAEYGYYDHFTGSLSHRNRACRFLLSKGNF